ncbi:MAG: esterase/lipase family protein [Anaerolineales bacterium]
MDISTLGEWLQHRLELRPVQTFRNSLRQDAMLHLLNRVLGEEEVQEIRALLDRPTANGEGPAVVLLPGFLGSILASTCGISTILWFNPAILLDGHVNLLELDDTGRKDRTPDVSVVPIAIEKVVYLKLILTLARETRLYEFPYDWRHPLERNVKELHAAIQRWAQVAPDRRFILLGHSMGGMLARAYAAMYPQEAEEHLDSIVMLGSPLYGAPLAVLGLADRAFPGKIISRLHPNNEVGKLVRTWPSMYQLLPPPPELFPSDVEYPTNWDIYDAEAWGIAGLRQDYLDGARRFHRSLAAADPQVEVVQIAGCYKRTLSRIRCARGDSRDDSDYQLDYQDSEGGAGDGIVPLWSVQTDGISTYYAEMTHEALAYDTAVIEAVIDLVHGGEPALARELPEPRRIVERLGPEPLKQRVASLRERLEQGTFSREDLKGFLFRR